MRSTRLLRSSSAKFAPAFIVLGFLLTAAATAPAVTPAEVDAAIAKARDFILSQQVNGNWEMVPARIVVPQPAQADISDVQWGGTTAIATYALLAAGENPNSEKMKRAIAFLERNQPIGIYALGLHAQIWQFLPAKDPAVRAGVLKDGNALLRAMHTRGPARGLYHYLPADGKDYDHSVSQYGVLGMWACAQMGFETPQKYWLDVDKAWRRHQNPDGGWSYINHDLDGLVIKGNGPDPMLSSASMTAAGIATLFVAQDQLHPEAECRGNIVDPAIEKALLWMDEKFAPGLESQDLGMGGPFYALYGVSRIGVASGRKYFGTTDWYQAGANWLVRSQSPDGAWPGGGLEPGWNYRNVVHTAFSLLFLVRGRATVVMNKLEYKVSPQPGKAETGNWCERPRDAANVVKFISKQLERDLNWQVVNLDLPVEELHDAPILYIAGNQPLDFTPEQIAKLKTFIEEGGMIYGNADCGNAGFARTFERLGAKMFPYEFRLLPEDHIIYTDEQFDGKKWRRPPGLMGMSNGVREIMLLQPDKDFSRNWQTGSYLGHEESFQAMADIFLYAVDKTNLQTKGESYLIKLDPQAPISSKKVRVARLQYAGNWDPEPGGWRRLAAHIHNADGMDLEVEPVEPGQGKLAGHQLAVLTGTAKFHFTAAQRDEIRKFVTGGGTLVIDAAGGSTEFGASVEEELVALFPGTDAEIRKPLSAASPVFAAKGKLEFEYRMFARKILGKTNGPRIRGITLNGRAAVLWSPEDLSGGLVGEPVDGVYGYTPASATRIMESIVLYAANGAAGTK